MRNKSYSLRAYAKRIGVSPGTISELMKGNRKVSFTRAMEILQRLDTPEAKKEYLRLCSLKEQPKTRVKILPQEAEEIISHWEYFAIHSLLSCEDRPYTVKEVARRLTLEESHVPKLLKTMVDFGLLESDGSGFYVTREEAWGSTDGVPSRAIVKSHYEALELAKKYLSLLSLKKRDYISLTFPADPDSLELARREVRRFKDRIAKIMQGRHTRSVFRLQVQLFDLNCREEDSKVDSAS